MSNYETPPRRSCDGHTLHCDETAAISYGGHTVLGLDVPIVAARDVQRSRPGHIGPAARGLDYQPQGLHAAWRRSPPQTAGRPQREHAAAVFQACPGPPGPVGNSRSGLPLRGPNTVRNWWCRAVGQHGVVRS
jgi:hypothetical protein